MTKKKALQILIQSSLKDIRGAGRGIRSTTDEWRKEVKEAIRKLHPDAYGYQINEYYL